MNKCRDLDFERSMKKIFKGCEVLGFWMMIS